MHPDHKVSERARNCARELAEFAAAIHNPRAIRCAAVLLELALRQLRKERIIRRTLKKAPDLNVEDLALLTLMKHPKWSNTRIARKIGCDRGYLSILERFVAARKAQQAGRQKYKHGDVHHDKPPVE